MRKVLSLSMPKKMAEDIKNIAKERGFDSVSAYIKHLVKLDKDLISETELLKSIKKARKEYKEGEAQELKSLSDLE